MKWRDDTITKAYAFSVANTYIRRSCILDANKNIIDIVHVTNRIRSMDIIKHLLTLYVSRRPKQPFSPFSTSLMQAEWGDLNPQFNQ